MAQKMKSHKKYTEKIWLLQKYAVPLHSQSRKGIEINIICS